MIPHYRLYYNKNELNAVKAVLNSQHIVQGEKVREFEMSLASSVGINYCAAVSSGTNALIFSLLTMNIGSGDEVIIPSYTCSALWHAVKTVNASPVFADIETNTFNLDPDDVKNRITSRTKAIIFPHMFGQPGNIEEVLKFGIPIIEDIAQAVGARIKNNQVGNFGEIVVTSVYATKVIGAGEGGAVLSSSREIIDKVRDLREYDEKENLIHRFSAKMTDITAAIAIEQLKKLSNFIEIRKSIFRRYKVILGHNVVIPTEAENHKEPNYYRCIASHLKINAKKVINTGKKSGITFRKPVYKPLHLYHKNIELKNTEECWEKHFSIPIYPALTDAEIDSITLSLSNIFKK